MGIIIRQSIKGTIVNYVGAFIGFLTTFFISTKYLTPEEIGLTRTLLEAATLLAGIALLGIPASAIKFFPYFKSKSDKAHNGFFFYLLLLSFVGMIITFSLTFLFRNGIQAYFSKEAPLLANYFYWIFPLAFFLMYQYLFDSYSNVLMRIVVPRLVREVLVRILTIFVFLSYVFFHHNLDWLIFSFTSIYAIAALVDFAYIARIGSVSLKHNFKFIRKPLRKYIFNFTAFMVLSNLGSGIINRIDIFMISASIGLADTGIYSIAFFMAAIIEIPSRSIGGISLPILSTHIKEKNIPDAKDLLHKVSTNQFLIGCFAFLILWINIDNIFSILPNGDVFVKGKMVVFFIGMVKLCDALAGTTYSILSISKHYYYTLFFIFFLSFSTIIGNLILIPIFGITGAALAAFLTVCLYYILVIITTYKKMKLQPFSPAILKIVLLAICLILLNIVSPTLKNPIIDGLARTLIFGGIYASVAYILKISPEMNHTGMNIIHRIKSKING